MITTTRTTVTSWFATCSMGWGLCAELAGSEHRRDRRDQASRLEAHIDARVWQGRRGVWCAAGMLRNAYLHDCADEAIREVPLGVRSTLLSLAGTRSGAAVGKDCVLRDRLLRDPSTIHLAAATQPSETDAPTGIALCGRRSGKHVRCQSFVRRR